MFIECVKNNGTKYLRLLESKTFSINGAPLHRRIVVLNIGPLSRFDDNKPEYLKRLRESFFTGEPLIPSLKDFVDKDKVNEYLSSQKIRFELDKSVDSDCYLNSKNIGYFLLDGLFDMLGIYDVLNKHKSRSNIDFDVIGLTKLLVFGRTLEPSSKYAAYKQKDDYLFPVTKSEDVKDVYLALDVLHEKALSIQKRMNLKIAKHIGRNTEVCFYDVTNYYFEISENDADVLDEEGKIIKAGLRKKGVSKENRCQPIVQMGLFLDDNGIPISYQLFPGNNIDQTTLRPAMKKTIDTMDFGRVIIVADGGLNSDKNIGHILNGGNGYIVSKSTKKSDKRVKKWILEEGGYTWNDNKTFKVKSQIRTRTIKLEDGRSKEISEKLVCYWSKGHYDKERRENEKFMEYLNSVCRNPDKLKDRPKKIEQFLKKTQIDKVTGEVVKTTTELSLDMDKIREYFDLMGYYTIMTSEVDKPDEEIISKYHGLSRIEDAFRITKSDLEGRPVFVRTPEHINAHFLTCFVSLAMIRIIQYKILQYQGKATNSTVKWEMGLSAERIQKALLEWNADALSGEYFKTKKPSGDMKVIFDAFGIDGDIRIPTIKELRSLKYAVDKAPL